MLNLDLDISGELIKADIVITGTSNGLIESSLNPGKYFDKGSVTVNEVNYFSDSTVDTIDKFKQGVTTSLKILNIALLLTSASMGVAVLKVFQAFDYLRFINIDLPVNVERFLDYFDGNMLDIMPALFEFDELKANCNKHLKLVENDMSCLLLNNTGEILTNLIFFIVVKSISLSIFFWTKKANSAELSKSKA